MAEADYDYDNHVGDDTPFTQDDFRFLVSLEKTCLSKLTDIKLLNKILSEGRNRRMIDNIIPNRRFRAYAIAQSLQPKVAQGKKLTPKQRKALENVYAFYLANASCIFEE